MELTRGGWLDVPAFLKVIQQYLLERLGYAIGHFDSQDVNFLPKEKGVRWKNITARKIIFCQGWQGTKNSYFSGIPMNNARGDILTFECAPLTKEKRILNRNGWILPIGQNQFRAGATYDHDYTSDEPTEEGREIVTQKIQGLIKPEFNIVDHQSAIRPSISRNAPGMMGVHPQHPELVYLNGLGSKGVSRGPSVTKHLVDYLLDGKPIPQALDICERFEF